MTKEATYKSRVRIFRKKNLLEIRIPIKKNTTAVIAMILAAILWIISLYVLVSLALHIHHFWAKFGLILSILSWSALGMAGASFFIWLFFGRERIIITPEYLITDKPLVFFYRRNFYTLKEIANIRLDKEIYKVNRKGEWVDESRPVIKFDTDKKLVTFARGIAKEEAEQIILEIAKSSPLQKEQFSAEHKI